MNIITQALLSAGVISELEAKYGNLSLPALKKCRNHVICTSAAELKDRDELLAINTAIRKLERRG